MVAFEPGEVESGAYTLFVEADGASEAALLRPGRRLERSLRKNYHYRYCRDLGQLGALRVFRTRHGIETIIPSAGRAARRQAT